MRYIGIDLGTTNSAICSYDGETITLHKSPEQHDVTPSAIYLDKRGNRYLGQRAYQAAPRFPDNTATKFKRMMGTSTPIRIAALDLVLTPEECSAEILKLCYGYLPESVRNSGDTGTVITVPAAFNQMQKEATLAAAEMAGIGKVALMQEPVAAVMSVMQHRQGDGIFLVFDLGGGTLDIAIAESISGRVSLLAHGGVAMCGGADFDRAVLDNVVKPWLHSTFSLPTDLSTSPKFKQLLRMSLYAAERAKIELSAREEAVVALPEADLGVVDEEGAEVFVDIPLPRATLNELIAPKVDEAIAAARETLEKAGLSANDVERIVFVGGPTHYKPLRDRVAFELGIAASTDVNPMTAVAEGAAVFAESIDWSSQHRGRKSARGTLSAGGSLELSFQYTARTPDHRARMVAVVGGDVLPGCAFQVDSLDTGWSSGRSPLTHGATVDLALAKPGDNRFKVFVFDAMGAPLSISKDVIVISRTAASIDAIPASHSIGVEVREKLGGRLILEYLVREGDQLPAKGKKVFKAAESLKAGDTGGLKFKLWEGDITEPVDANRFIGMFEIKGTDVEDGAIAAGADLVCDYEVLDSGNIVMEVTVPSIRGSFHSGRNFYSRQEGQIDFSQAAELITEQSERALKRLDEMTSTVEDARLQEAREKLNRAALAASAAGDPEAAKQALENVQDATKLMAHARKAHLPNIRQLDLDHTVAFFNESVRQYARPSEVPSFESLVKTAQRTIDSNSGDFEGHLDELRSRNFNILWRQDWFVIDRFKYLASAAFLFPDGHEHAALVRLGQEALAANDIQRLREVAMQLYSVRIGSSGDDQMMAGANIVRS